MGQPKQKKKKNGQPPPIDKLMKPAIAVGLAMLAYQFIKGMGSEVRVVRRRRLFMFNFGMFRLVELTLARDRLAESILVMSLS